MSLSAEEKRARLEKALLYGGGTHTVNDVVQLVRDGKAQFWDRGDGSILTELHDFPRLKAVHFWTISGVLRDCLDLEDEILAWARAEGCAVATACGRPGWGRVAAPTGWKLWHPNFVKQLGGRDEVQ
jgi:hypothetical protein